MGRMGGSVVNFLCILGKPGCEGGCVHLLGQCIDVC